jgi:hypothetical protein
MFARIKAALALSWAVIAKPIDKTAKLRHAKRATTFALAGALAGCLPTTAPLSGADPADPAAKIPRASYRSVVAPYTSLQPAEPGPWLEQNRRLAPAPKSGQ